MLKLEALESRCLLSVTITDSFLPNDDMEITFPETLTGWSSPVEQISITNNSNTDHLLIGRYTLGEGQDHTLADANFSLIYPASVQTPPGYSSSAETMTPLGLDTIISGQFATANDQDWYRFEAQAGQVLDLGSTTNIEVFNNYGGEIETIANNLYLSMVAPYTGSYYLRAYSTNPGSYQVLVATPDVLVDSMVPGDKTQGFLTTNLTRNDMEWLSFNGQYGDVFTLKFNSNAPVESNLEITVFNSLGDTIYTQDNLTQNNVLEFPVFGNGAYHVRVASYYIIDANQTYVGNNSFSVELQKNDTIFTIEPSETLTIPVWFLPTRAGEQESYFHLNIDTDLNGSISDSEQYKIGLYGSSVACDILPAEIHLPTLPFDIFAQSGKNLTVAVTVKNVGQGNITSYPNIQFYLSANATLDGGDAPLSSTVLLPNSNPVSVVQSQELTINSQVAIPAGLNGSYSLFAVVNQDKALDESDYTNNTIALTPLLIDRYDTIIYDKVAPEWDSKMDMGSVTIGSNTPPSAFFIGVYNRGSQAVDVSMINLGAASGNFSLNTSELNGLPIQPGEHRAVWVQFSPQSFNTAGLKDILTDKVEISTSQNAHYTINLQGKVLGPDLNVLENSQTPNDDKIYFGNTQIGTLSTQTITLFNQGNQNLNINEMVVPAPFRLSAASQAALSSKVILTPGQQLGLTLEYAPAVINTHQATATINSSDEGKFYAYTLTLNGNAVDPTLVITESAGVVNDNKLSFGSHPLASLDATPIVQTVRLQNKGNGPLSFSSPIGILTANSQFVLSGVRLINSDNTITHVTDITQVVLQPGQTNTLELDVQFLAAQPGFADSTLAITTNYAGNFGLPITAFAENTLIGLVDAANKPITGAIDFNTVIITHGNPLPQTAQYFSIVNKNTAPLTLTSLIIAGDGFSLADTGEIPAGGKILQPGESFPVKALFTLPVAQTGLYTGALTLNPGLENQLTIDLNARATSPEIAITNTAGQYPVQMEFGATDIGGSRTLPLTISNVDGSAGLNISWACGNNQFMLGHSSSYVIPAGQSRTLDLIYRPVSNGAAQGQFTIYSDDLDEFQNSFVVSGISQGQPLQDVTGGQSQIFFDADGDRVEIQLNQGYARVYLNGGSPDRADISLIELYDTTEKTVLDIRSKGEVSIGTIRTMTENGSLGTLKAPAASILNGIHINGSLTNLTLNDIAEGAAITTSAPAAKGMTIKVDRVGLDSNRDNIIDNVLFSITGDIKTFQATAFNGDPAASGALSLTAGNINRLTIRKGDLAGGVQTTGQLKNVSVYGSIQGNLVAGQSIGSVTAKSGAISGNVISQTGSIGKLSARTDISGMIMAAEQINSVTSGFGAFSGVLRATGVKSIKAAGMDHAIISAVDYIGSVTIKTDVIDSLVLAGYDIGLSTDINNATNDGALKAGQIGAFKFGGEIKNSYVTAGVMTENIYASLYNLQYSGADYSSGQGSIKSVSGKLSVANNAANNNAKFGFYTSGDIARINLTATDDFVIMTQVPNQPV